MTEKDKIYELDAKNVYKYFGVLKQLMAQRLWLKKGKLTALIGPNGSGKSTFYNVITGFWSQIKMIQKFCLERKILKFYRLNQLQKKVWSEHFNILGIFPKMTVLENMLISPQNQIGESMFWGLLARPLWKIQEAKFVRRAKTILEFLEINHVINHLAEELSGGQQKLLAIGRLLMAQPSLLLLDEPVAGVNPTLANKIFDRIIELKRGKRD